MMKRIAYDYLFNYFGGDTRMGKIVTGASITLNIRAYKDGKEVLFEENVEPKTHDTYLSDVYKVHFDKEKMFIIEKNLMADNIFRLVFGWDKIEAEPIAYSLDVAIGLVKDNEHLAKDMPDEIKNLPMSEPVEVSEQEFLLFLKAHKNDFDISDNKSAQVPSVMFFTPKD